MALRYAGGIAAALMMFSLSGAAHATTPTCPHNVSTGDPTQDVCDDSGQPGDTDPGDAYGDGGY